MILHKITKQKLILRYINNFNKQRWVIVASYIESNLTKGENIIKKAQLTWWSQISYIVLGILLLPAMGLGLLLFIPAVINMITTELALTNKRVIAKTGFIRRDAIELRLEKVEGVVVSQGLLGRIFNYGDVVVTGTGGIKTPIPFIAKPLEFRRVVNEYLDNPNEFN